MLAKMPGLSFMNTAMHWPNLPYPLEIQVWKEGLWKRAFATIWRVLIAKVFPIGNGKDFLNGTETMNSGAEEALSLSKCIQMIWLVKFIGTVKFSVRP